MRRPFDAAESSSAILLFDECDALVGKRSEARDSHDRYANVEVSYLLQRMEAYHGLAILTTNMKDAVDGAFLRCIRFHVQFPFPVEAPRMEFWRRAFPPETPLGDLEFDKLARHIVHLVEPRHPGPNAAGEGSRSRPGEDGGSPGAPVHLQAEDRTAASRGRRRRSTGCPIDDDRFQRFRLDVGDIVVIRMADPGKVGIVEREVTAVFASYLVRLKITSEQLDPYFLFYFLTSDRYQGYITGASTGTTRKSASASVIAGIDIALPPRELRGNFNKHVSPLRQLLNHLLEKNTNLRTQRDLLLPKLISGEIDVSDFPDRSSEAAE